MTLNCRVEAGGDLATLTQFLFDIENSKLALKVDGAEFTARDNDGQQLTLGLQLNGLALNARKK